MNFLKKHYRTLCGVLLVLILVCWTTFLNKERAPVTKTDSSFPAVNPTAAPKPVSESLTEKTPEAVEEPATEITSESVSEPDTAVTKEPGNEQVPATGQKSDITSEVTPEITPEITPAVIAEPTPEPAAEIIQAPTQPPAQPPTQAPTPTQAATPTPVPQKSDYTPVQHTDYSFDYCYINVKSKLNIRSGPDTDYDLVGVFPANSYATVISKGSEWTKLYSNGIYGYCMNDYLKFGKEAVKAIRNEDALKLVSLGNVNIRSGPSTNMTVLGKAAAGDTFNYLPEYNEDGWYALRYENQVAYMSEDLCEIQIKLKGANE